ncbi:MAG: DVUA0089 family protein [Armatimonadetes bacterium]|nr:DVUA0089 family protein [Armatimonadota bacterium]
MRLPVLIAVAISLTGVAAVSANAATFTFASTNPGFSSFLQDNDVSPALNFSTTDPFTQVDLLTDSYGDAVLDGFDPTVALFNATTGELLGQSADVRFDADLFNDFLSVVVPAGNYSLYVTQYDNLAVGLNLADGFTRSDPSENNYTGGTFADINGANHTGAWRVNVVTVAVPETPSVLLSLPGLIALAGIARRRNMLKGNKTNG